MTIAKSRLTIATVTENEFNDYVRVMGQVLPSRMSYLDAIEGGRVEELSLIHIFRLRRDT